MCSRYRLAKGNKIVITIRKREYVFTALPRYNIAPMVECPVLVCGPEPTFAPMKWGWQPVWSKQLLINAKAETVMEKPTFKKHIGSRCLILADGFYEWTRDKTPIMFTKPDGQPFCFAGLHAENKFIILTTSPSETVATVHNRMPLIVQPDHYDAWLGSGDDFQAVLASPDRGELNARPVQRALNNVRNDGEELIDPPPVQEQLW